MGIGETLRMLVTVKAYPAIGRRHGEAVCVAGVDVEKGRWIRLYPVAFRDLPNPNQFKKYQIVELNANKASDPRPESYTPNLDSLRIVSGPLPAGKSLERRRIIEPLVQPSMCAIRRRREQDGTSLGVFRPGELLDLEVEEDRSPWDPGQQAWVDQPSMLMPGKTALEKLPFRFRYVYRCDNEPRCPTHRQSIIDWEIGEAFRSWREKYGSESHAVDAIRQKWVEQMFHTSRDSHLFTGNRHDNPDGFLVLGVFWPSKASS